MTPDVVSVRPGIRLTVMPAAFLLAAAALRAFADGGAFEWWVFGVMAALFLAALVAVRFACAVTVTPGTVTVRLPLRTVSFDLGQLRSVSGGRPPGKKRGVEALRFEGLDGTRTSITMVAVSLADRRRLVAALTERTTPDVVRWDAPMREMLAEAPETPAGPGPEKAAGPRSEADRTS
ncbi:hypothetical protein OHT52_11775 [Streptomyces sp. NBC_00247]|uniref:hypothetical protein n=1 Tax=Streptomyces sp. NBC_00247 TaxID=2975689 RepID=UPI002E290F1F|nr:hypothetical protein [Streptomyces sp. NBC_00247]